jgi:uncharacterized membrane protein
MEKTKLGVSVGLVGAAIYLAGAFGGILAAVILGGYVLLFEQNAWLKKAAVKAIAVLLCFAVLSAVIGLIPDFLSFLNYLAAIFGGSVHVAVLNNLTSMLLKAVEIIRTVLLIALGLKALNQQTVYVPVVDEQIKKYMD